MRFRTSLLSVLLGIPWVFLLPGVEAHTLYIKSETPADVSESGGAVEILNGTFWKNEAPIDSQRLSEISIIEPGGQVIEPNDADLVQNGRATELQLRYSLPGTYVLGVKLRPRQIRVAADDFNYYLKYEGLLDDAKERRVLKEERIAAAERYTKFAKSIIQVGQNGTENFSQVLGHRAEVVPLVNPGELHAGSVFRAQLLLDGKPLAKELVYANTERMNETDEEGVFKELISVRSDDDGVIQFEIPETGSWYVRFIHLVRRGDSEHWYSDILVWMGLEDPAIPYESLWATLTFEIN